MVSPDYIKTIQIFECIIGGIVYVCVWCGLIELLCVGRFAPLSALVISLFLLCSLVDILSYCWLFWGYRDLWYPFYCWLFVE